MKISTVRWLRDNGIDAIPNGAFPPNRDVFCSHVWKAIVSHMIRKYKDI